MIEATGRRGSAVEPELSGTAVGSRPRSPQTAAPVDVLLHACRATASECLSRDGPRTAAPAPRGDLEPGRRSGAIPLYLTGAGPRLVCASTVRALLRDPAVPQRGDDGRIHDYLAGRPSRDPAATFLSGIRRLPPALWPAADRVTGGSGAARPPAPRVAGGGLRTGASTGPLPSSAEFLGELPEAIRQREEPFTGVGQYLDWRAATGRAGTQAAGGGDAEAVAGQWLRARRAGVQGLFRSPAFCGRPYWDGVAVAEAFRRACGRPSRSMTPFWRLLNLELWLRLFADRPRERLSRSLGVGELERLGDPWLRVPDTDVAACPPHEGRHAAMTGRDGAAHLRLPVRTRRVGPGEPLAEVVDDGLDGSGVPLRPGDVLILAEKIVAIGQGRVVPVDRVRVRALSRWLARFVFRTPSGISLGLPESFELAVREAGLVRILAGSAAAALTRPLGVRGVFYWFTGWEVAAIDSPDPDALPPSDSCIKLAPRDPEGVAVGLADHVSERAGTRVEVAVVDVNDIGAEVLGASPGVDRRLLVSVLRDNPLGQDTQQTPVGIVRRARPVRAPR